MKQLKYIPLFVLLSSCNTSNILTGMIDEQAPVIIYSTTEDYYNNVPIILNKTKDKIVSYPAPSDLLYGGELSLPIKLNKGYLLDRRGINVNTVFTSYTYSAYSALETSPSLEELYKSIIEMNPFESIYQCGKKTDYGNLEKELNRQINNGLGECAALDTQLSIDALFESYYQERLALNPITATSIGDNRYDDRLANFISEDYQKQLHAFYTKYKKLVSTFDVSELNPSQQIGQKLISWNCNIMLEGLENEITLSPSPPNGTPQIVLMPINQIFSFHLFIGQLASGESIQPFNTTQDYDNWLKRIDDYLDWIDTVIINMKIGLEKALVLPRIITERMIAQLDGMINSTVDKHLFYSPAHLIPEHFTKAEHSRIENSYHKMVEDKLVPAYSTLRDFLKNDYLSFCGETAGMGALPHGKDTYEYFVRYHTTTDMTPDEIFELGQHEVSRILAEMEQVKMQVGFEGDLKAFFDHVRTNKNLMPFSDPKQVIDNFNAIHDKMKPRLDKLFDLKPKTGFEVKRTEVFRENSASAEYIAGTPDGSRKGVFYVPLPDVENYNIYSDEDLFLHEAIPGHHYQISLQQENQKLPAFQRSFVEYNAYIEGWALYTESLGKELGLYEDPYQYFGMLSAEMHRAIRLVVDVGMHARGWTREKAIQYSLDHEAEPEASIISEIERYMVAPGQALSYKIGQLKIRELRSRAEKELGINFNIKEFHNQILDTGSLPLVILEEKIDHWISQTQGAESVP